MQSEGEGFTQREGVCRSSWGGNQHMLEDQEEGKTGRLQSQAWRWNWSHELGPEVLDWVTHLDYSESPRKCSDVVVMDELVVFCFFSCKQCCSEHHCACVFVLRRYCFSRIDMEGWNRELPGYAHLKFLIDTI